MNQKPQQADFVLGTCPDCGKVVRIPVTAVTSQSRSQVSCPMCGGAFEIADILDEVIPSVKVIDEPAEVTNVSPQPQSSPEKINAIDTPELFHASREDYQPKTEKKNGRFVVPELLSKGSKSSRKKKKSGRRKSRKKDHDPKLAESLAKLKQNTSATSIHANDLASSTGSTDSSPNSRPEPSSKRSEERHQSRSKGARSRRSNAEKGSADDRNRSRSHVRRSSKDNRSASRQKSNVLFADLMAVRSLTELKSWAGRQFSSVRQTMNGFRAGNEPNSKWDVMMIIIGFLIAVPTLHLMMWWFIGIDPLGLARPTSYVTPFIVPNELRAEIEEPELVESPTLTQEVNASTFNTNANSAFQLEDGRLPTPKLDPSSVHAGDNN